MQQSKVVQLIQCLNGRERKSLLRFLRSEYFNTNKDIVRLYEYLNQQIDQAHALERKQVFEAIFDTLPYQEALLNHLSSALLKLVEQFCGQQAFESDRFMHRFYTIRALSAHGLDKHYRFLSEQEMKQRENSDRKDTGFHFEGYLLENLEANRISDSSARIFNEHVQKAANHLDYFYLTEKLKFTCYMLTSQLVIATPYNLQLVDEICKFIAHTDTSQEAPAIQAYFCVFQLLIQDNPEIAIFEQLKKTLQTKNSGIATKELFELYPYAINFCNLQILKARPGYDTEALNLYIEGVSSGILLQNGCLSPWHFKNMIKLGLRLEKFEWTERFILEHTDLLEPSFREDAYHYNLAELYYYTNRFDAAMIHLNKVEFTDVHYNLGAKVLLAKIYHETDADEALESLLQSFKLFLRRSKMISENIRKSYLFFIEMLRKILHSKSIEHPVLLQKIEQSPMLVEKNWLIRQLNLT